MHSVGASHIQTKPTSQTSRASKCFYKLLSFLTWPSGYSISLQYLFLIASHIQYILILLTIQLDHFDSGLNSGLALTVNEICKALLLRNLTDAQIDGWILTVYIYLASMLSGACLLIFLAAKKLKASTKIKHLIVTICQFHLAIAFWLCNAILLYSLTDARDYHMKFFKIPFSQSSLMGWHIFLLILNFFFGGVFAIYSYDPLKWSNEMAMPTPISQVLTFALKGIVCLLLLLVNEGAGQKWLLGLFSLIISGYRHFHLISRFPYYEHKPLRISSMMSSIAVLISFLSILILCFKKIDSLNGNALFYMEALIVCLGVKFSDTYFVNKVLEYLAIHNLKSEDDVLKKVFSLYDMRRNTRLTLSHEEHFSLKEIQFWGIWSSYSEHKEFTSEKVSTVPRVIEESLDARIYELLSGSVEKFKENKRLKLFLANFILHQNEGMLKGLDYLQQLRGQGGFIRVKSAILWEEYQKKLESKYEGSLDVKTFLQFEENSQKFVEMIYFNSKRYADFWKTYTKTSLDLMDLVNQSERIEEADERITKFWSNFELKERYLQKEFLILYSVYLSIVRNARYAASKLRKKLMLYDRSIGNNIEEPDELTQETLMSADNFAFHVSMEKENFGKILHVSENAGRKLGWQKNELLSKNLEMMIPRFMRKESMLILRGGDGKILKDPIWNKVIDCFLMGSENWMIPCHGFFCLYPNIKEELKVMSLFRLKMNREEMMIVNKKGVIQGATEKIGQLFDLEGMLEKASLEDICPELTLNQDENEKRKVTVDFNLKGNKDKIILKECCVSIEEYILKEKLFILKILCEDVLKAEKREKKDLLSNLNLKSEQKSPEKLQTQLELLSIQEQEEDEEAIPSEKLLKELDFTVNSPVTSTRNLITPKQKMVFDFSTPRAAPKRIITTIGENQQTTEDLLAVKYTSEPSFLKEEKILHRYQSRKSEEYNQETSIVSSQASSQRMELEEVLHVKPKDRSMRALNTFFGVYIVAAIILLISFKILHTDSINTVTKNAEVSTAALLRLMRICNMYAQAGTIVKLDEGTFFADRYRFLGLPNLKYAAVNGIPAIARNLLDSNIELRQYVSKIEDKFEKDLYMELPMFFYNQNGVTVANQTTNPFELVDLLVATADRISHTMFLLVRGNSPDVLFIYKNSIDRLLVLSEQGLEVIVVDTEAKLNELFHMTVYFFVAMGVFGLALFCFFIYIANKVVKDQEKTFEHFRRLDEEEIVNHTKIVEFFCSMILQSDMNIQLAAKKVQQKQSFFSESFGQKPTTLHKGKRLNTIGVYKSLIQTTAAVLVLLLLIFSGYIILLALVKTQNGVISTKVNLLTSFNFQAYEQSLLKFVLPDYLGGHVNMTVRSQPFIEEWDKTFKRNLEMGDSLLQIIDPDKGFGDDEMLVELVTGNLCELIVTDITIALNALGLGDPCDKIVNGVARKGVKAAYDYSMYWMQSAVANFEASGKTKLDSIKALNATGQKQMEMLGVLYVRTAMERISNRMEAQLQKDAEKFIHSILVVVVVYVVIYATVVLVIWYKIQKEFAGQRIKWKRLFKLVPEAIILSNKALTLYLLKNRNRNQNWMNS